MTDGFREYLTALLTHYGVGSCNGREPEVATGACTAYFEGVTTVQRAAVTPE